MNKQEILQALEELKYSMHSSKNLVSFSDNKQAEHYIKCDIDLLTHIINKIEKSL